MRSINPPADASLLESILRVIAAEGPIADDLLVSRISNSWGFQRAGIRIRTRVLGLVPRSIRKTKDDGVTYYWPENADPDTWTDSRLPGDTLDGQRDISMICRQELANLLCHVIAQHAGVSEEQTIRDAARLLGIGRLYEKTEHRLRAALHGLLRTGRIITQSGSLIIPR